MKNTRVLLAVVCLLRQTSWENDIKSSEESPFAKFYVTWKKARMAAQENLAAALDGQMSTKETEADEADEAEVEEVEEGDFWAETAGEPGNDNGPDDEDEDAMDTDDDAELVIDDKGDRLESMGNLSDEAETSGSE